MPRKSHVALNIEEERLKIIHSHQKELRKRLSHELKVKKASKGLPGEEAYKKNMAIFLKIGVPGITFKEIGARIGETQGTVRQWFYNDPYVREQYEIIRDNLKDGAFQLAETYMMEAIETVVLLMRYGSEKAMLTSSLEILDRTGLAKLSKSEAEITNTKKYGWEDQSQLLEDIRRLPPERQEEAIAGLERLQQLLTEKETPVDDGIENDEDEDDLNPILGNGEEEDDNGAVS